MACVPHAIGRRIVGYEEFPDTFDISWTAHLPFDGRMNSLRPKLAELRENAGRYIVPCSATAKETPELGCFDPNDCHCTNYSGVENVRWEWECGPWLPGTTECIGNCFRGLKRWPECAAEPKRHKSRVERSPGTYGGGYCAVEVQQGRHICKRTASPLHSGTTPWIRVHTTSLPIKTDWGWYWCPTPGCRNYHRGLPNYAGPLRHREFRKECRHYGCQ